MATVRRTTVVLSEEEFQALKAISKRTRKSVSRLVREAVRKVYLSPGADEEKRKALEELSSLSVPVGDWEKMEREIEEGLLGKLER